MKKKIFAKIDDMYKQEAENMKKLFSNMEQLTSSIVDGFAMLRLMMMMQPPSIPPQFTPHIGYQTSMYNRSEFEKLHEVFYVLNVITHYGIYIVARDLPGGKRSLVINMMAQHITFNKAIKPIKI